MIRRYIKMNIMKEFKDKARQNKQKIVLPEGVEPRIINALTQIKEEKLADIILLGQESEIKNIAQQADVDLTDIEIINPHDSVLREEFAETLFKLRKEKGLLKEAAFEKVSDPLYFGVLMVYTKRADGLLAGSINATGDVLRPALQIIKTKENISVVSGAMIMDVPDTDQLAEIAVSSAETAGLLPDLDPVVAMLSFSTKGSAKHGLADKVIEATNLAQKQAPDIIIDGELQLDAAIVPSVAEKKSPESPVAGKANVLIFPDLQAGNIGYKLVQRLAKADAIGPILQGMAKPVNDLSRGCSVQDIVNVVTITAVQAQNLK